MDGESPPAGPVLIIDNEDDSRFLLCEALRARGFLTLSVASAAAALLHLARAKVAAVVTDVQMPGMSGIELCRELRRSHPSLVVIVMSSAVEDGTWAAAIAAGATSFLPKPVKVDTLAGELRTLLEC